MTEQLNALNREYAVYNRELDQFYNLDYIGDLTTSEFYDDVPPKGFTEKECINFMNLKELDQLSNYILNIYQPKFNLIKELEIYRGVQRKLDKEKAQEFERRQQEAEMKRRAQKEKVNNFMNIVGKWDNEGRKFELNGISSKGINPTEYNNWLRKKPVMKDYNITPEELIKHNSYQRLIIANRIS